jgi:hypothetical protein
LEGSIAAGMTTAGNGSGCIDEIDLGAGDNRAGGVGDHTVYGRRKRRRRSSGVRSKNCRRRKQGKKQGKAVNHSKLQANAKTRHPTGVSAKRLQSERLRSSSVTQLQIKSNDLFG